MPNHANGNFDQFLTPESMLTPGIAGSMSMMIGNTLQHQFHISNGWSILVLSFVFGLLVLATNQSLLKRSVYYVLNSLVIFCVAAGAISVSSGGDDKQQAAAFLLIPSAYAQQSTADMQAEYKKLSAQYDELWGRLKAAPAGANNTNLLHEIEGVDSKRAAVLRSIEAQTKGQSTNTGTERKFFAPLKF
jgi:hypothetical protein